MPISAQTPSPLSSARWIGVLGDAHGDMGHVLTVSETMWKRGVAVLLVLGENRIPREGHLRSNAASPTGPPTGGVDSIPARGRRHRFDRCGREMDHPTQKGCSLESLMDSTTGAYRILTATSTYWIDLDRMVLRREPRTENPDGSLLRRDAELITLHRIVECTVGRRMELHIDLHVVGVGFTTRWSTPVTSIERVASPGEHRR